MWRGRELRAQLPNEAAIARLVGAPLLEQSDESAVPRARYMTLETRAPLGDSTDVSLPHLPPTNPAPPGYAAINASHTTPGDMIRTTCSWKVEQATITLRIGSPMQTPRRQKAIMARTGGRALPGKMGRRLADNLVRLPQLADLPLPAMPHG
jgi:hypothetical protein